MPALAFVAAILGPRAQATLVLLLVIFLLDKVLASLRPPSPTPVHAPPPPFLRSVLATLARLTKLSYSQRRLITLSNDTEAVIPDPLPPRVESLAQGDLQVTAHSHRGQILSRHAVIDAYDDGALWLLRPRDAQVVAAKWIVLFRGTKIAADFVTDARLTFEVAAEADLGLRHVLKRPTRLLTAHVFPDHNVHFSDSIMLVGHSLGATLAEATLLQLRADGYTAVSAVGFDSPGLPNWFRSEFPSLVPAISRPTASSIADIYNPDDLTLVYVRDNFINNLAPAPAGALSFCVAKSSESSIFTYLPPVVREIFSPFWFIADFVKGMVDEHRDLARMADLLENGEFSYDVRVAQGNVIEVSLKPICKLLHFLMTPFIVLKELFFPLPTEAPFRIAAPPRRPRVFETPIQRGPAAFPEFPTVESAVAEFNRARGTNDVPTEPNPYVVRDVRAFVRKLDTECDIVCPLVGVTSAGKTSLVKALLDLPPSCDRLRVRASMDTTLDFTVMLWRVSESRRVWLLDMPGVRGAGGPGSVRAQLFTLRHVVQAACYVSPNNPAHAARELFRETVQALGDRVLVVCNPHQSWHSDSERDGLVREARTLYGEVLHEEQVGAVELRVLLVRVVRAVGASMADMSAEHGVRELRTQLLHWLRERHRDIVRARRAAFESDSTDGEFWHKKAHAAVKTATVALALLPAAAELAATGSVFIATAAALGPLAAAAAVSAAVGMGLSRWS